MLDVEWLYGIRQKGGHQVVAANGCQLTRRHPPDVLEKFPIRLKPFRMQSP
jgi:hypothetical protein